MNGILPRRTFAIISHPDAGKTTLTEKLLLYGGAVRMAGTVTARKKERATASDWMELERQRGISISSTVLQFDYGGFKINLLDTPGHRDFSEDTYRVLTAVDAAVMVIDAGKGIENQTRKLFEVCRRRGVPIFTFMNKMDRPARAPIDLLDEVEKILGIDTFPMNWPLGAGPGFRGVYDRLTRQVHLFERTKGGAFKAPLDVLDPADPIIREKLLPDDFLRFSKEIELIDELGTRFDAEEVLAGKTTPVFFGSAVNSFGVQLLLDGFLAHSPPPIPRRARPDSQAESVSVPPDHAAFSAFIFKIQANMHPRHRDRIAFARVCSGVFSRNMAVHHMGRAQPDRSDKKVRLTHSHKIFGKEREIIDEAYPGDIVGLVSHADFQIGDTLSEDPAIIYDEIPRFPPECFVLLQNPNPSQFKSFRKGLEHLIMEGLVQPFFVGNTSPTSSVLGAVGPLQFEVLQYRLQSEYGVESRIEPIQWQIIRWTDVEGGALLRDDSATVPSDVRLGTDAAGRPVIFFPSDWSFRYFNEKNPEIHLYEIPAE